MVHSMIYFACGKNVNKCDQRIYCGWGGEYKNGYRFFDVPTIKAESLFPLFHLEWPYDLF